MSAMLRPMPTMSAHPQTTLRMCRSMPPNCLGGGSADMATELRALMPIAAQMAGSSADPAGRQLLGGTGPRLGTNAKLLASAGRVFF